jgi:hypothetical protein
MPGNFEYVPAGELKGNLISLNPGDPARIFAQELAIHTDAAAVANLETRRGEEMHQRATERDILDRRRVMFISQFQKTVLFGIDPYV